MFHLHADGWMRKGMELSLHRRGVRFSSTQHTGCVAAAAAPVFCSAESNPTRRATDTYLMALSPVSPSSSLYSVLNGMLYAFASSRSKPFHMYIADASFFSSDVSAPLRPVKLSDVRAWDVHTTVLGVLACNCCYA